eukprot:PhM_4_TR18623/c0_g1_i1/m.27212
MSRALSSRTSLVRFPSFKGSTNNKATKDHRNTVTGKLESSTTEPSSSSSARHHANTLRDAAGGCYKSSKYTLFYEDTETEKRFSRYLFVGTPFYGGKLLLFSMVFSLLLLYVPYHVVHAESVGEWFHVDDALPFFVTIYSFVGFVVSFISAFDEHRELMCLLGIALHIPSFVWYEWNHKVPERSMFGYVMAYNFCVALVPGIRYALLVGVIPAMHWISFLAATFLRSEPGYWTRDYTWMEAIWWPLVVLPVGLQYYLERTTRHGFEIIDRSTRELSSIQQRLEALKLTVVSFFPGTVTKEIVKLTSRDGLSPTISHSGSHMLSFSSTSSAIKFQFNESVVIVTDIAGFTSWTARTDNHLVVNFLSDMFTAMDTLAQRNHVEKVTTVGDSFIGMVFGGAASPITAPLRCMHACHFGLGVHTTLSCSKGLSLRHRVGIHFGDVIGGFVGISPPRFDVFGDTVDHARHLESTCSVGKVHASHDVFSTISAEAVCGMPIDGVDTPYGVVFSTWCGGIIGEAETTIDVQNPLPSDEEATSFSSADREKVLKCILALGDTAGHDLTIDEDDIGDSDDIKDTDRNLKASKQSMHWIFLYFFDERVERLYKTAAKLRQGEPQMLMIMILLDVVTFLIHYLSACMETVGDRVYFASTVAGLILFFTFQTWSDHTSDTYPKRLGAVVFITFIAPVVSCTFISTPCDDYGSSEKVRATRLSNVIMAHSTAAMCACHFVNNLPIGYKIISLISVQIFILLQVPIRAWAIGDDVYDYDFMVATGPGAFSGISYLSEWSLRRAFLAHQSIAHSLRSTGHHAKETRRVLDVMLPPFVSDKLIRKLEGTNAPVNLGLVTDKTNNESELVVTDSASFPLADVVQSASMESRPESRSRQLSFGDGGTFYGDDENAADDYPNKFNKRVDKDSYESSSSSSVNSRSVTPTHRPSGDNVSPKMLPIQPLSGAVSSDGDRPRGADVGDKLIWQYPALCAIFLSLRTHNHDDRSTGAAPDAVNFNFIKSIMESIEDCLSRQKVLKVKTVGTTMFCVCGVEQRGLDGAAAVQRAIAATAVVVRSVLSRDEFDALGYVWSIGLHCGPCFGAVLGVRGLSFDFFGDTINTASRMMTTAGHNEVHVSAEVVEWLGGVDETVLPPRTSLVPLAPLIVKGKGTMYVFRLDVEVRSSVVRFDSAFGGSPEQ